MQKNFGIYGRKNVVSQLIINVSFVSLETDGVFLNLTSRVLIYLNIMVNNDFIYFIKNKMVLNAWDKMMWQKMVKERCFWILRGVFFFMYRFATPRPQRYSRRSAHAHWVPTSLAYALTSLQSDSSLFTLFTDCLSCLR